MGGAIVQSAEGKRTDGPLDEPARTGKGGRRGRGGTAGSAISFLIASPGPTRRPTAGSSAQLLRWRGGSTKRKHVRCRTQGTRDGGDARSAVALRKATAYSVLRSVLGFRSSLRCGPRPAGGPRSHAGGAQAARPSPRYSPRLGHAHAHSRRLQRPPALGSFGRAALTPAALRLPAHALRAGRPACCRPLRAAPRRTEATTAATATATATAKAKADSPPKAVKGRTAVKGGCAVAMRCAVGQRTLDSGAALQ
jgi:hypothetical protein